MRLIVISLATVVALAACTEPTPPAAATAEPAGDAPAASAAAPAAPPASNEPTTPTPPSDECGAAGRQGWIGRGRADLPAAPAGAVWRIYETGQPVTMDYSASRLNIEINPESQRVVRVSCG